MRYFDAHCHLQDERIVGEIEEIVRHYDRLGVREVVVNGTSEADWSAVADLCERYRQLRPSFGLHPWRVNQAGAQWQETLAGFWDRYSGSGVGEIGLDRWIEGHDLSIQEPVFLWQLEQARIRDRPVSIHCLRAWGRLLELLSASRLPARGFLLHSYAGPKEMVRSFVDLGGYFSISGYFAHPRKTKQRDAFTKVPLDRILVETDAPDMSGPASCSVYRFSNDDSLNHPANLVPVYAFAADLFGLEETAFREQVASNYRRFFETR